MDQILQRFEVFDHIDHNSCVGAVESKTGIVVEQPWGFVATKKVRLTAGWYVTEIGGESHCAAVQYKNHDTMDFLEVSLEVGKPVYLSLDGGLYSAVVLAGGRPRSYSYRSINLRRLSWLERVLFFARRGLMLLKGAKFNELANRLKLLMSRKRGYGAVAHQSLSPTGSMTDDFGPLSNRDRATGGYLENDPATAARLARLADGPVFSIHVIGSGVKANHSVRHQIYKRWRIGSAEADLYHVYIQADATLTPDALLVFAEAIARHPATQVLFCDDWINGRPTAKPAFDPFLYKDFESLGRLFVTKARQDRPLSSYDAHLVEIIAVPLVHTDAVPMLQADHVAEQGKAAGANKISVIIPTRDRGDLLKNCVDSLEGMQGVDDIIVVDNGSVEPETFLIFEHLRKQGVRVIADHGDFNFSRLCNFGAEVARNPILAFVNNDIEFIGKHSLSQMAKYCTLASIGPVGTLLLYRDNTVQHAGVALGLSGAAGHPWRHSTLSRIANEPSLRDVSLRSAVTAACMVVEAKKFWQIGGFDSINYPVTLNDIDLCLRLSEAGFQSLFVPQAVAYHLESISRGLDEAGSKKQRRIVEMQRFNDRWSRHFEDEKWLSPLYSRGSEIIKLR